MVDVLKLLEELQDGLPPHVVLSLTVRARSDDLDVSLDWPNAEGKAFQLQMAFDIQSLERSYDAAGMIRREIVGVCRRDHPKESEGFFRGAYAAEWSRR